MYHKDILPLIWTTYIPQSRNQSLRKSYPLFGICSGSLIRGLYPLFGTVVQVFAGLLAEWIRPYSIKPVVSNSFDQWCFIVIQSAL